MQVNKRSGTYQFYYGESAIIFEIYRFWRHIVNLISAKIYFFQFKMKSLWLRILRKDQYSILCLTEFQMKYLKEHEKLLDSSSARKQMGF